MSMKHNLALLIVSPVFAAVASNSAMAQTGAFGGGQSAFGSQSAFSNNVGTAANAGGAAGGTGAAGATGGTQTTFGTLALDPSFGATAISSAAGGAALGNSALGRTGLGGLGGIGGLGGLGGGFGGGLGGLGGGFGGLGGRGAQNMNNQNETKVRATVKIGFDYDAPAPAVRSQAINSRLARIPLPAKYNTVQVAMQGRKAVITGTVPTTEDGKLIERLLSLEPGIDDVDNQLVFTAESKSSTSSGTSASQSTRSAPPPSVNRSALPSTSIELVPTPTSE